MNATTPISEAAPTAPPEQPVQPVRPAVDRERLTTTQRVGEVVGMFFTGFFILVFGSFFVYHQVAGTGFFTAKFGLWEMVFFYGPMLLSLVAPFARALTGQRNPGRLVEAITNVIQMVATIWLLTVFPFNFAHLADPLPAALHVVFSWITNDIARAAMIFVIVICPIVAMTRAGQFVFYALRASGNLPDTGRSGRLGATV